MNNIRAAQLEQMFQKEISKLKSGEEIVITVGWAMNHGIIINQNEAKAFGKIFRETYYNYNCYKDTSISPGNGAVAHKSSDNLCHYKKN